MKRHCSSDRISMDSLLVLHRIQGISYSKICKYANKFLFRIVSEMHYI